MGVALTPTPNPMQMSYDLCALLDYSGTLGDVPLPSFHPTTHHSVIMAVASRFQLPISQLA